MKKKRNKKRSHEYLKKHNLHISSLLDEAVREQQDLRQMGRRMGGEGGERGREERMEEGRQEEERERRGSGEKVNKPELHV